MNVSFKQNEFTSYNGTFRIGTFRLGRVIFRPDVIVRTRSLSAEAAHVSGVNDSNGLMGLETDPPVRWRDPGSRPRASGAVICCAGCDKSGHIAVGYGGPR